MQVFAENTSVKANRKYARKQEKSYLVLLKKLELVNYLAVLSIYGTSWFLMVIEIPGVVIVSLLAFKGFYCYHNIATKCADFDTATKKPLITLQVVALN